MTNTSLLEDIIKQTGLKKNYIANKLGISSYGLAKKINNECEFKASEIILMCEILGITSLKERESIFFVPRVD